MYVNFCSQGECCGASFQVVPGRGCSVSNPPPYLRSRCGPINRYPPWQFESLLAQNLVPAAGVLTVGSCAGCEADSLFAEKVTSFEPAFMNTTSGVTSVVSRTGSESACMNTTSEVTSAVSVVHRLSEDISDSSSNSSGDGDMTPPSRGRCCDNGRDGWFQVVGEVLQCVSSVGLPFSRNAGP